MKTSKTRRTFLKRGALVGMGIAVFNTNMLYPAYHENATDFVKDTSPKKLRILILGGTSFLGPHQIAYALSRGHEVSTFTRGKTEPTVNKAVFKNVQQLIGDRENDLTALEKGTWDVVIDNSGRKVEWTSKTATLLKDRVNNYLYTSSTGVYYPYLGDNITENLKVLTTMPEVIEDEEQKLEYEYGVMKANSELAAQQIFGADRSLLVRPTYMMGPGDRTDRFIYWPIRLSRGGDIMVPGKIDDPVQYIDVRDVAEWMIRSAEEKRTGTYNVVGPKTKQHMPEFVAQAKEAFEVNSKLVQIDDYQFLKENGVPYLIPWILPEGNNYGSARVNNQKAVNAGLTFRAIKDSIHETFEWWESDALTEDRRNQFEQTKGSLLQREKAILERWRQHLKLKN